MIDHKDLINRLRVRAEYGPAPLAELLFDAADALATVQDATDEHYAWALRRARKFGRDRSDCTCEICRIRDSWRGYGAR